jgi:hypothetical protein
VLNWLDDQRQRQANAVWQDWSGVDRCQAPAERARAERGVRLAYREAGLTPPERIVWCQSPLAGARTAAEVLATSGQARADLHGGAPWAPPRHAVADPPDRTWPRISRQVWEDLAELAASRPFPRVGGLRLRLHDQVADELATRLGGPQWQALQWGRFCGQPVALDLARCDLLRRVAGSGGLDQLNGFAEVARSAGWCWPLERTVVLTERPHRLLRDDQDRLHADSGPALEYPDGFALWRWHGVRVPRWVVEQPGTITLERIRDERDVRTRRVLVERYGPDRYLREAGGEVVQRDHCGNLWRAELPGDEPLVMIEVRNATPEPDGSRRTFWLRVPPQVLTALEGVAWSFDLPPERYRPRVQT